MRTAIIIPVHNRRDVTLRCLRGLAADGVPDWADLLVVDDGSSDGTAEAVAEAFPKVHLLRGDGSLWWTGGIALGMRAAADAEVLLWLNDDTLPGPGACAALVEGARRRQAIVTGQCRLAPGGSVTYGGLMRRGVNLELAPQTGPALAPVDAACGNFVAIPRAVVDRIGFPDAAALPHAHGDTDYTLRARAAGFRVLVDPQAEAIARPNALGNYASWLLGNLSVADVWRPLFDRRSYAYAPAHARFLFRHFGWAGALHWTWTVMKRVPITALRIATPLEWRRRVWGPRSRHWQEEVRLRAELAATALKPATSDGAEVGGKAAS